MPDSQIALALTPPRQETAFPGALSVQIDDGHVPSNDMGFKWLGRLWQEIRPVAPVFRPFRSCHRVFGRLATIPSSTSEQEAKGLLVVAKRSRPSAPPLTFLYRSTAHLCPPAPDFTGRQSFAKQHSTSPPLHKHELPDSACYKSPPPLLREVPPRCKLHNRLNPSTLTDIQAFESAKTP